MTVLWLGGALAVMLAPLLAFEAGVMAAWMVGELRAERASRRRLRGKRAAHASVCSQRGCLDKIAVLDVDHALDLRRWSELVQRTAQTAKTWSGPTYRG